MGKYHINFEGKIYPCKAKVFRCPYGDELHSDSKVELYYKLMGSHGTDAEPSETAVNEFKANSRLKSLYALSSDIEKVDYPVDVVVATLKESLAHVDNTDVRIDARRWRDFEDDTAEDVSRAYRAGVEYEVMPAWIPDRIRYKGRHLFQDDYGGVPSRMDEANEIQQQSIAMTKLRSRIPDFEEYEKYMRWGLKQDNLESTYAWMTRDFVKFSHDLNTSKMITQPVFYGDLEKAKETIANMDNYELLSTLDDYSVTDKEIERSVKEANYFKYRDRADLSVAANKKMEIWYNRNSEIYSNWKINTPKRVLLSMEVAKELDRRTVIRQDSVVGEMLADENKD